MHVAVSFWPSVAQGWLPYCLHRLFRCRALGVSYLTQCCSESGAVGINARCFSNASYYCSSWCMKTVLVTGLWTRYIRDSWSHDGNIYKQGHVCDYEALSQVWVYHLGYIIVGHFSFLVLFSDLFCWIERDHPCVWCDLVNVKACEWMSCILLNKLNINLCIHDCTIALFFSVSS